MEYSPKNAAVIIMHVYLYREEVGPDAARKFLGHTVAS